MRIAHRHRDTFVSHQLLDGANIYRGHHKPACKRVAQAESLYLGLFSEPAQTVSRCNERLTLQVANDVVSTITALPASQ
jgi:hypothetical protein